jgi:DNA-binding transcriptional regulator GbsR (MarR family)
MGQLYSVLLLSPKPLSLDELAERLDISKGSVSMNMQALERWGTVKEVWVRGDRRKYYEAETDLWKIISTVLEGRERREVELALRVIGESIQKLQQAQPQMSPEDRELAELYLARIADLQAFFRFAQMALEAIVGREVLDLSAVTKIEIE